MGIPDPLTPPESDLQDFAFMPLHVARLRDSDLAAEEEPEACWYAVLLWAVAWHQLPAGSLPDNDAILAKLIGLGRDLRTFRKHKAGAMRGFVRCSDGRLYHPVVAEQVIESWGRKLQQRWRTECGRLKKHNQRTGENVPLPSYEEWLSSQTNAPCPQNVPHAVPGDNENCPRGQSLQGTEIGTGTGTSSSEAKASGAEAPRDLDAAAWVAAVTILVDAGETERNARTFFGRLLSENGLMARDMLASIHAAVVAGTRDPKSYLRKAAQGIAKRRAPVTPKRQGYV